MNKNKYFWTGAWILLIGLVFLTYFNHFKNPFEFDDEHTIVNNSAILSLKNISHFFTDATTFSTLPANQTYRPGLTTLNAIDVWLGGQNRPIAFYFHCHIFCTFIVLGILFYFFILSIFNNANENKLNKFIAFYAVAWFWVHTANAETINYIISRDDLFSTLMVVLAFIIYIYKPAWRKKYLYLLPVIIGFSVKEPTIMFAPLLFFYILLFEKKIALSHLFQKENFRKVISSFLETLPAFVLGVILFAFYEKMLPPTVNFGGGNWFKYLITQAFVIVHYFNDFILPVNLSADTDWTIIPSVFDDRFLAGIFFILGLIFIAIYTSKTEKTRPIAFGIIWFFVALIPTSTVVPLAEVLNDHRTFFPYLGLFIAFSWSIGLLIKKYENVIQTNVFKKIFFIGCLSFLLIAHAYGTHHRNQVWSSPTTLWKDVTIKSPNNGRGWMNYGDAQMANGDFSGANYSFNKARSLWPRYSYIYINLGVLKNVQNQIQEAESNFKQALLCDPKNPEAYYYYGNFLAEHNRTPDALVILKQGLALSPDHIGMNQLYKQLTTYNNLAANNTSKSNLQMALDAVKQQATPENYVNLSLQYYLLGNYQLCIDAADKALALNPNYDLAYNNICSAYNMLKQWNKAIEAGEKGLKINPNNQLLKNNLAVS
ncbi:MAG TPA: tetratricopeptide repeat protein, partial [Bacteroidia bacterium]|nr:tetratricopeptide repeat protein [Bacteroidia bacterium]